VGVIGHHRDLPTVNRAEPGHHTVGRKIFGYDVGVEAVLDERTRVQQKVEALARGELVLLAKLGQVAGTALKRPLAQLAMARIAQRATCL
jgi:hypothetical protein